MAFIQLRISEEDKAVLEAVSRVRGISLSDYIRQAALDVARAMQPGEVDEVREWLRQNFARAPIPAPSGGAFDHVIGRARHLEDYRKMEGRTHDC